jgi:hypothetical protein
LCLYVRIQAYHLSTSSYYVKEIGSGITSRWAVFFVEMYLVPLLEDDKSIVYLIAFHRPNIIISSHEVIPDEPVSKVGWLVNTVQSLVPLCPNPLFSAPCKCRFGYDSDFAKLASIEQEEQADYVLGVSLQRVKAIV